VADCGPTTPLQRTVNEQEEDNSLTNGGLALNLRELLNDCLIDEPDDLFDDSAAWATRRFSEVRKIRKVSDTPAGVAVEVIVMLGPEGRVGAEDVLESSEVSEREGVVHSHGVGAVGGRSQERGRQGIVQDLLG
jgi:hypothetical protein